MKTFKLPIELSSLALLSLLFAIPAPAVGQIMIGGNDVEKMRQVSSCDSDWRFHQGELSGAEQIDFDDSAWRKLDVPHDWSIEGPFDKDNPTRGAGGFLPAGVGWYRKHFALQFNAMMQRVVIEFDGVMANSDVWINGFHLGKRPYGYVSFRYELTDHLDFGDNKTNVLAVRADNSAQPASRWYAGAGIYRHVRLIVADAVHIAHWATFVTPPQVSSNKALVRIQTAVTNQSSATRGIMLHYAILSPEGKSIAAADSKLQSIASHAATGFQQDFEVTNPKLW